MHRSQRKARQQRQSEQRFLLLGPRQSRWGSKAAFQLENNAAQAPYNPSSRARSNATSRLPVRASPRSTSFNDTRSAPASAGSRRNAVAMRSYSSPCKTFQWTTCSQSRAAAAGGTSGSKRRSLPRCWASRTAVADAPLDASQARRVAKQRDRRFQDTALGRE
jgi:hypothetical protein